MKHLIAVSLLGFAALANASPVTRCDGLYEVASSKALDSITPETIIAAAMGEAFVPKTFSDQRFTLAPFVKLRVALLDDATIPEVKRAVMTGVEACGSDSACAFNLVVNSAKVYRANQVSLAASYQVPAVVKSEWLKCQSDACVYDVQAHELLAHRLGHKAEDACAVTPTLLANIERLRADATRELPANATSDDRDAAVARYWFRQPLNALKALEGGS